MLKKLFGHTAIYGLAPHISKIASFFVLPIITSYLTPTDYGIYGVVTAVIGSISVLSSLGLRVVLVNSFFKNPIRYTWLWRQVYGFLTFWIIPYAILSSLLVYFIIPDEAHIHRWEIILINVLPLVFFGQTSTIASTYYQINKRPFPIAIRSAIFGTLTVLLNLYTIAVLKMGYMGWFWSTFAVTMLNNLSYWIPLNMKLRITPIFNFKWRLIRNSLRISLPTVPHYYSGYLLNTSDRLVLEFLNVPTANIGKYNAAYTFGNYVSNLGIAAGFAVGPMLNECYKKRDEVKARKLIFALQFAFFAITFGLAIWMNNLFAFFVRNSELNSMYALAIIIVMSYNYRPMYIACVNRIIYNEKTKILWRISLIAGLSNVAMNVVFVSLFDYRAAAYVTFASLMYMGYAGFMLSEVRKDMTVSYYPLVWLVSTALLTATALWIVEFNWMVKGVITMIFGLAFCIAYLKRRNVLAWIDRR